MRTKAKKDIKKYYHEKATWKKFRQSVFIMSLIITTKNLKSIVKYGL